MNEEDVKLYQQNTDPHAAESPEANSPSADIPANNDAGKLIETDESAAGDISAADSSETKSTITDLPETISSEVKPSETNLPVADSSEAKSTDLSAEPLAAIPAADTSSADSVNPPNSSDINADIVNSPESAIAPSGTDDSNIAESDSDHVGNTTETPIASDDDSPTPSILNRVHSDEDYYLEDSSCVDIFTLAERGLLGRHSPMEFRRVSPDHTPGADTFSDDQPMSGIDDETTESSENQIISCINDDISMLSIPESQGSDHDSVQTDPPDFADLEDQDQAQEALSRKRNIQHFRVCGLQEDSSSSELSAQNSPARRPFFKSTKRTKSAPKGLNQSAQSSKPDSTPSQDQGQAASSSEPQPSTSRAQDQPADSTEASSSSTRAQGQPESSRASSSSARAEDQVADLSEPSTSLVRGQNQQVVLSQPSTSFARAQDPRVVLSQPSSFARAWDQRTNLSRRPTSFPRSWYQPVILPYPYTSFSRANDQQLVLFEPSTPFSRTRDQASTSLIPSTSFGRIHEEHQPIYLPQSIMEHAVAYARRLSLIVARTAYIRRPLEYTNEDLTQLMWNALEASDGTTALYALRRGADINYCPRPNWTALHGSVVTDDLDFSLGLLERGAQVNRRDSPEGYTPLHLAALWDKTNMAVLLLQNGARAAKKDLKGKKPIEYAKLRNHARMVEILESVYIPDDSEDTEESEEETDGSVDSDATDKTSESL